MVMSNNCAHWLSPLIRSCWSAWNRAIQPAWRWCWLKGVIPFLLCTPFPEQNYFVSDSCLLHVCIFWQRKSLLAIEIWSLLRLLVASAQPSAWWTLQCSSAFYLHWRDKTEDCRGPRECHFQRRLPSQGYQCVDPQSKPNIWESTKLGVH